jgi:lipopolysaccharide export system protein LptC
MSPRQIAKALTGFGAVALVALVGVTVYIVHHRSTLSVTKVAGLVPGALLHAHNFNWVQMKAGELQWTLTARDASYSASRTSVILTDARLKMTSNDGKPVLVRAPHAVLTLSGNHVTRADLNGGTRVHYGEFVLTTNEVVFLPDQDEMQAPGQVTIVGNGLKITGVGLDGHPKTRQFELLKEVHTELTPKSRHAKPSRES